MTAADMLPLLKAWAERHAALHAQMDALAAPFGGSIDGPLFDAVWQVWDGYTEALAREIGDHEGWLAWFHDENDMGRKAMDVETVGGMKCKVRGIKQLARIIAFNRPAAASD